MQIIRIIVVPIIVWPTTGLLSMLTRAHIRPSFKVESNVAYKMMRITIMSLPTGYNYLGQGLLFNNEFVKNFIYPTQVKESMRIKIN